VRITVAHMTRTVGSVRTVNVAELGHRRALVAKDSAGADGGHDRSPRMFKTPEDAEAGHRCRGHWSRRRRGCPRRTKSTSKGDRQRSIAAAEPASATARAVALTIGVLKVWWPLE